MGISKELDIDPRFITDAAGKRSAVVLSIEEFEALMAVVEDYNDAIAFNQAVRENTEFDSLDDVITELSND